MEEIRSMLQAELTRLDDAKERVRAALAALGSEVDGVPPTQAAPAVTIRRTRKPMSKAAKAAVSKRMRAYWAAKRRAAKG